MVRQYVRSEDRPLPEVMERRREHYLAKVNRAFKAAYTSGDFDRAEKLEKIARAMEGNLEGILVEEPEESIPVRKRKRPKPDFEAYAELRDSGKTNEEIRREYKISGRQIAGFSGAYSRHRKKRR